MYINAIVRTINTNVMKGPYKIKFPVGTLISPQH